MKTFKQFQEDMSKLPGLDGGGGGTNSITDAAPGKSLKKRVKDVGKILTRPFHKVKKDPTEKFATEDVNKKIPPVTGLSGGGGGTDSITDKAKTKSLGKRIGDVGKILTRPFHKKRVDPTEKFASEEVAIANSMSGGGIAGSVEAGDEPPVNKEKKKKKKTYAYGGRGSRKMWMT